jgi:hypothetical protein
VIASTRRAQGKSYRIAAALGAVILLSAGAAAQTLDPRPATLAALEAAAEQRDAAGAEYLRSAKGIDEHNGETETPPQLGADKYQRAAAADDNAGQQYEAAAKDWKEAADTYKAAAEAIKGFNDAEAKKLTEAINASQGKFEASKKNAIEAYLKAAVEHDKAVKTGSGDTKLSETALVAKSRESAGHVGKSAAKDKDGGS